MLLKTLASTSDLQDAAITEAVQLIEEQGPLDDGQAMREAICIEGDSARIAERARVLGARIGLQDELARARAWAPWLLIGLAALVALIGLTLAAGVVGGGERRINVVTALVGLLGMHLLTLVFWLVGLLLPAGSFNASFGGLWLALTARVAGGRRGQAPLLLRAATRLLARARLVPWALGFVSHAVWSLAFAVVLAALLFALAFRSYTLSWETTILEPAFFVRAVQLLGWAPAAFGFPVPVAQVVLSPVTVLADQRIWALWLTGCILVYGLLPRLALAGLSAFVWRLRRKALRPDLSQPYYSSLTARFEAMAPRRIVDADPGHPARSMPAPLGFSETTDTLVAVGFELPDELPWPPEPLAGAQVLRVDGSAEARRELLDLLARVRPQRVLVGCSAASSPDRGTERFLRDVISLCGECRLWLVGGAAPESGGRWRDWLADAGLDGIAASYAPEAALRGWM